MQGRSFPPSSSNTKAKRSGLPPRARTNFPKASPSSASRRRVESGSAHSACAKPSTRGSRAGPASSGCSPANPRSCASSPPFSSASAKNGKLAKFSSGSRKPSQPVKRSHQTSRASSASEWSRRMIFSKLAPMKAIAVILKRPLGTLRTRRGHRFNNPVSEGSMVRPKP